MGLLLFYLLIALFISFLCSILEAVILSVTPSYIQLLEQEGKKSTEILRNLKTNIDKPLSAILSINTVAHTIGAAGVGAQAVEVFGETYFGLISAILTLLILIFSEIIPKTIGANYWRELAISAGMIIRVMIVISFPLVWISDLFSKIISKKDGQQSISREEIAALAQIGQEEGVFEKNENEVMQNLLKLKDIKVKEIMTPRTVVRAVREDISLNEFLKLNELMKFSRIPVYKESMDDITSYVLKSQILQELALDNHTSKIADYKRDILMFYESVNVPKVFQEMLLKKEHISLIIDEYGGVEGIVSMEDIVETLLGYEIVDEHDSEIDMQIHAKEQWEKRIRNIENKDIEPN